MFYKILAFSIALVAVIFYSYGPVGAHYGGQGGANYLAALLKNPLVQCRLYGGTCMSIDNCDTTDNIYKDVCKSYSYDNVCCISRQTVCQKFSGFCTNMSSICITSANLFNNFGHHLVSHYHKGHPYVYKTVALSWLACNATHRCCHPVKVRKGHNNYYSHGHGGHGGHGGYGNGYGFGK